MGGTSAERRFKQLVAKKESMILILQSLLDLSKNLSSQPNQHRFLLKVLTLDQTRDGLIAVIDEINQQGLEVREDFAPDYKILPTIDEMYCHIKAAEERLNIASTPSTSNAGGSNGTAVAASGMSNPSRQLPSLPKIELPEFSGEFREWETFYGVFKSLIHDNATLNDTDKIHYLIGRLRGAALRVCSGITPTGDNYNIIWNALIEMYQDKRWLANSYLEQIMNFRPLVSESSKNLNFFLERFDAAVSAIKNLNLPDLDDTILFYQARKKLDKETIKAFDNFKRGSKTLPTFSNLITLYIELISFVKEPSKLLSLNASETDMGATSKNSKFATVAFFVKGQVI